jgi:hypothetical protein
MCLVLYLSTPKNLQTLDLPDISIQLPEANRASLVRTWTTFENVYVIGSRNLCGCDFPYVITSPEGPLDWDWRAEEDKDPSATSQIEALKQLIATYLDPEPFELWPIQNLTEAERPWEKIDVARSAFVPETFFFNERFLYRVAGA